LGGGAAWEGFVLLRSLGPTPLDSGRLIPGFMLAAAALLAMILDHERKTARGTVLGWVCLCLVFFGWYQPIASGDRFLLPLVPTLTALGCCGLVKIAPRLDRAWPWTATGFCAAAVAATVVGSGPRELFAW
jgi:hypothetical protein